MQQFRPSDIRAMLDESDHEQKISCYLPVERAGRETRQNTIQIRNMLRRLESALRDKGRDKRAVDMTIARVDEAIGTEPPTSLRQSDGLAVFAAGDDCRIFGCRARFVPRLSIARRYDVLPLVPLVDDELHGTALVLARHCVRVIDISHDDVHELELDDDFPRAWTDAVGTDLRQPGMQQHSVGTGAIFHGHGEGNDDVLPELEIFCRSVADALAELPDVAAKPLAVAADVKLAALFRRTATQLAVLPDTITGNYERADAETIAGLARPLLRRRTNGEDWADVFSARLADGRASDSRGELWRAALDARIDTLLIDRDSALAERDGDGEPDYNAEAVLTLRHGGKVHLLGRNEMPSTAPLAAIFRF